MLGKSSARVENYQISLGAGFRDDSPAPDCGASQSGYAHALTVRFHMSRSTGALGTSPGSFRRVFPQSHSSRCVPSGSSAMFRPSRQCPASQCGACAVRILSNVRIGPNEGRRSIPEPEWWARRKMASSRLFRPNDWPSRSGGASAPLKIVGNRVIAATVCRQRRDGCADPSVRVTQRPFITMHGGRGCTTRSRGCAAADVSAGRREQDGYCGANGVWNDDSRRFRTLASFGVPDGHVYVAAVRA